MKKGKLVFLLLLSLMLTSCNVCDDLNAESFTSKLIPNWPSFVAQLGALVVLIVVFLIFGYKPVKKILKKRQDYIEENINQPMQASDIAEHVNLSTSYFLKKFKSELGVGVSEYITRTKTREACMLLKYTDKSLTEISNYLYFSSQSYFQNVFKKQVGITPNQYRNQKSIPVFMNRPEEL